MMPIKHFGLVLAIALVWGLNFVVAKYALEEMSPLLMTGLRFTLVSLMLAPFLKFHPGQMKLVLIIGVAGGALNFGLFFAGLTYASASAAAVFVQLNAPFSVLLSVLFLGERLNRHYVIGLMLAFGGVMVLSFDPSVFSQLFGLFLITLCGLSVAASNVLMKKLKGVGVLDLQVWIAVVSFPLLALASFLMEDNHWQQIREASWVPWAGIVYMGVAANLIGHGGVYFLLQRYEVSRISTMLLLAPCIGILSGVMLLDEPMSLRIGAGALTTLIGVAIIALKPTRAPIEATQEVGIENVLPEVLHEAAGGENLTTQSSQDSASLPSMSHDILEHLSPNFDPRPEGTVIDTLIMHYTGMETGEAAINRLCDPEAKVSAHYVVEEDGRIFKLVEEESRAWHAGLSFWQGRERLNDCSIGIEIVNPGHEFGYRPFPREQMDAVIDLARAIIARHQIPASRIIGHSDIAPDRKIDPGELFDWQRLALKGIGHFIDPGSVEPIAGQDLGPGDEGWQVQDLQTNLAKFGYRIDVTNRFDEQTEAVVSAFQRHYRPEAVTGLADLHTQELLRTYLNWRE